MSKPKNQGSPPGRVKIIQALRKLLEDESFNSITTGQIAKTAGVTEGLIYKYFKDKRALLYEVLKEHFMQFLIQVKRDLKGVDGSVNKLRKAIWSSLDSYANHRVFARIIILEVRNSPDYFESEAYELVKQYNQLILEIINDGIKAGEIKDDISPSYIRYAIFGSMEHACMNHAIFNNKVSTDEVAENLSKLILDGISNK